jgi:hypothetical protein
MKKLNYIAPICSTGYGITAINILKQLVKSYDITLSSINNQIAADSEEELEFFTRLLDKSKEIDVTAPCLKIWHQFDLAQRIGKGTYFGFPIFELDTFDHREKNHLNSTDQLFVCSNWAKTILENNGIKKPVSVIPLGVDLSIFDESIEIQKYDNDNYILNDAGWHFRFLGNEKNLTSLIESD